MPRLVIRRGAEVNYVSGGTPVIDAGEERKQIAIVDEGQRGYLFRVWPAQTGSDDLRGLSAEKILEDDAGSIAGAVAVCVVEGDFPDGRYIVEGYHGRVLLDGDDAPRIEHGALVFRMGPGTERSRVFVGPS